MFRLWLVARLAVHFRVYALGFHLLNIGVAVCADIVSRKRYAREVISPSAAPRYGPYRPKLFGITVARIATNAIPPSRKTPATRIRCAESRNLLMLRPRVKLLILRSTESWRRKRPQIRLCSCQRQRDSQWRDAFNGIH